MHSPNNDDWHALKRLIHHLYGMLDKRIYIYRTSPSTLHAFLDADWAGNKDDYTSTMGHVIFFGHTPLTWCSRKQNSLAWSSTEAEYRVVVDISLPQLNYFLYAT